MNNACNPSRSVSRHVSTQPQISVQVSTEANPSTELTHSKVYRARVLRSLVYRGRIFEMKNALVVMETYVSGVWHHECEELGIFASGVTSEESFNDFEMDFALTWDGIIDESDSELTEDAKQLRNLLLHYVSHLVPRP